MIGYDETIYRIAGNTGELANFGTYFTGESSDWSDTQTVTILENNNSPTPTLTTPTDRNPPHLELTDYLLPIGVIVAVFIALTILLYVRHQKTASIKQ